MDCRSNQCNFKNGRGTNKLCQKCHDLERCYKITVRHVMLCTLNISYTYYKTALQSRTIKLRCLSIDHNTMIYLITTLLKLNYTNEQNKIIMYERRLGRKRFLPEIYSIPLAMFQANRACLSHESISMSLGSLESARKDKLLSALLRATPVIS